MITPGPMPMLSTSDWIYYFSRVVRSDGCWYWKNKPDANGYSVIKLNGRSIKAHRLALMAVTGEWPELLACHSCGNRSCVNPSHLYWGTAADNKNDSIMSGSAKLPPPMPGDRCHSAKLTWQDVDAIKKIKSTGVSNASIGRRYGVAGQTIGDIIRGVTWRVQQRTQATTKEV